jgi:proline iminopeptidase
MKQRRENYLEVAGGKIWYCQYGNDGNCPLIVIHGGPGAAHNYLSNLKALSVDRPVIFYDQLGSGRSDKPADSALWQTARFVDELARLVQSLDYPQVHLLGHSWGTIIAAEYALSQSAKLKSLILASPCLKIACWHKDTEQHISRLPGDIQIIIDRYKHSSTIECPEHQEALLEYYNNYVCRLQPWPQELIDTMDVTNDEIYRLLWGSSELFVTGALSNYDLTPDLARLALPTLFTCGRYDEASPATTGYYQSLIAGAEIEIFENSSHLPHLEAEHEYLTAIKNFLTRADKF